MQRPHTIFAQGKYDIRSDLDFSEIDKLDYLEQPVIWISDFLISPNSQFIAIIISYKKKQTYDLIKLLDIMKNIRIIDVKQQCDALNYKFSQNSQYFVYHLDDFNRTLNIIHLSSLEYKQKILAKIDQVYTMDNQNQIFLQKNGYIQIYSIEKEQFLKCIECETEIKWLEKVSSKLFLQLIPGGQSIQIFAVRNKLIKNLFQIAIPKQICRYITKRFMIFDNKLLMIEFNSNSKFYTQLKYPQNNRLIRHQIQWSSLTMASKAGGQLPKNLIQDNQQAFISQVKHKGSKILIRFNLILGVAKEFIFQNLDEPFYTYVTRKVVVNLESEGESLRYFVFEIQ